MPVRFAKYITPLPVGVWGHKETKPSFAEVPSWVRRASIRVPIPHQYDAQRLSWVWTWLHWVPWGQNNCHQQKRTPWNLQQRIQGQVGLQEQVSVTPSEVFASTPSVCGHRAGIRDPNFSSVIYALRKFNKAYVKKEDIFINVKPQVGGRATAVDTNKSLIARRNKMRNITRSPFSSLL